MKNIRRALIFVAAIICWLVGCGGFSLSPDPEVYQPDYKPELSVLAVISPDKRFEFVYVERTRTLQEESSTATIIKDATVQIISGGDTAQFSFIETPIRSWAGLYLDRNNSFQARAGVVYTLLVTLPDGRMVKGKARVPLVPKITAPAPNTKVSNATASQTFVHWETDPEGVAYQIFFLARFASNFNVYQDLFGGKNYIVKAPPATLDGISRHVFFQKEHYQPIATIRVMAMDRNYYDYLRLDTDLAQLTGNSLNLLEGGYGFFGAVNLDSVDVVLE